jgi:SAM-dependent methyltransferase
MSISSSDTVNQLVAANKRGWNLMAGEHFDTDFYGVESFKKGRNSLFGLEVEELGDITGLSLLHLQCHFGLDTMSFSRLGAKATGVDISDVAIGKARELAGELNLDTRFVCSSIFDAPQELDEKFDIVFASYGALVFMPDLRHWAKIAANFLKPGGRVRIVEIHPVLTLFDEVDGEPRLAYSLFPDGKPEQMEVTATYADGKPVAAHTEYFWRWSVGDLATALLDAGLRIESLRELPIDMRQRLPSMVQGDDGWWRLPGDPLPLVVTFVASKPN